MGCIGTVSVPGDIDEFRKSVELLLRDHFDRHGGVEGYGDMTTEVLIDAGRNKIRALVAIVDLDRHSGAEGHIDHVLSDRSEPVTTEVHHERFNADWNARVAADKAARAAAHAVRGEALEQLAATDEERLVVRVVGAFIQSGWTASQLVRRLYGQERGEPIREPAYDPKAVNDPIPKILRRIRSKLTNWLETSCDRAISSISQTSLVGGGCRYEIAITTGKRKRPEVVNIDVYAPVP